MSKYGEPLRRRDASIVRSDGTTVVKGTSRRDPRCTKCQCSASTFVHVESAERMIACTNACANIPHPERLPELVEAVRKELGFLEPEIAAAFRAVMGESE